MARTLITNIQIISQHKFFTLMNELETKACIKVEGDITSATMAEGIAFQFKKDTSVGVGILKTDYSDKCLHVMFGPEHVHSKLHNQ